MNSEYQDPPIQTLYYKLPSRKSKEQSYTDKKLLTLNIEL